MNDFLFCECGTDVISLHSILIAICSGISLLTFIVFVLERMDFFRSSNRFQMAKCQITDQIPRSTHSFEVYFNSPTRLTECNERVESSSDRSQLSNHSDFDFSAEATCVDRSFDQMSPLSCDRDFESTFDPMSDCDEYTRCLHNNDRQSQHHQDHHLHHHRHHCDHDHAQSESPRCSRLSRSSPDDCELHTLRRSRLSVRQLCREKLYDHLHYSRNNETYNFYRDLSRHEPHCPFYASHRSLVSYK